MKDSARYAKVVEWSEEDRCYVGTAPGLIYGGCHGDDERAVFDELCEIVEDWVELFKREGKPLPPATAGMFLTHRVDRASKAIPGDQVTEDARKRVK